MSVISDSEIAAAAKGAGLNNAQTAIAVAIALAESGGDASSYNPVPPDKSYGLWQINMLGSMGVSRRQEFNLTSNEELFSPATNAKAMFSISNGGQNWRPWTTYTRGTYLRFMARGNAVAGTSASPAAPGGITTVPVSLSDAYSSITGFFAMLTNPKFWLLMGILAGGAGLVVIGLIKMTGDNSLGEGTKSLGKAALGLVPGGGTVVQGVKTVAKVVK